MATSEEDFRAKAEQELEKMRQNCRKGDVSHEIGNIGHYLYMANLRLADIGTSSEELETCKKTGYINEAKARLKEAREGRESLSVSYIHTLANKGDFSLADIGSSKQELARLSGESSLGVTGVKKRSALRVFLLGTITLGIYDLVWYYQIQKEMTGTYVTWSWNPFEFYETLESYTGGEMSAGNGCLLVPLLGPIGSAIIQSKLNKFAE